MSRTRKIRVKLPGNPAPTEILATFVNPGGWFKQRWLVGVGCGISCLFYIVEAGSEGDAIDELVDSDWGHILKTDEQCEGCLSQDDDSCVCSFAGNFGERVDLDDVRILDNDLTP